ncbi:MAG: N-acetyltransferase [Oscillospiraceae bacterium]|nr:N-acetyltransferase [Oscillospiraceae bacterium]
MIRPMTYADLPRVLEIYAQSLATGTATFNKDCPDPDQWDRSHHPDCRLVYEEDGQILGFAMISPTSPKYHFRGVVEDTIYVDLAHLGKGIGTALLTRLCEEVEQAGYWTIYSSIFPDNTGSVKLHEKCGFRLIGTREKIAQDIFGTWRDTIIMERRNQIR